MPSAMSSPSEPVEMASTSMRWSLAPSRMIEPLPKFLSIWSSAAWSAFCLSMLPPSTTRSAGFSIGNPLFHELQMEAKRNSALDHNVHCFVLIARKLGSSRLWTKEKGASTGIRGARAARWSPGEMEGAPIDHPEGA